MELGDQMRWVITGKWMVAAVASVTVASVLAAPIGAHAMPHPSDADFGYAYNSETQQIGFWFGEGDGEAACVWSDGPIDESSPDVDEISATQCFVVDIAGPNGQVNHGSIVSAFAHELNSLLALIGFDGPRGQFISQVAQSDDGQGPPAWAQAKKDSRGSKNKGTGGSGTTSDVGDSDDNSDGDTGNGNGSSNGNGNGNGNSNGNGSSNASDNAKGKGIGKNG